MAIFSFKSLFSNPGAIQAAANAARDKADWPGAAELYERYLSLKPEDDQIWVQLGHAKKEVGEFSAALSAYLRALSIAPKVADTHLMLGHLRKTMGDLTQAAAHYADAVAYDPDALDPLVQLAFAEKDLGHDTAALTHFKKITQLDPKNQEAVELVRTLSRSTYKSEQAHPREERNTAVSARDNFGGTIKAMALELRRLREKSFASDKAVLRLETALINLQQEVRKNRCAAEARLIDVETRSPVVSQKFQELLDHIDR